MSHHQLPVTKTLSAFYFSLKVINQCYRNIKHKPACTKVFSRHRISKRLRCHNHCAAQHKSSHFSALRKHAGITRTINVMCLQLHQYILVVGVALCGSRSIKLAFPGRNCRESPTVRSPCEASTLLHRVGRLWS